MRLAAVALVIGILVTLYGHGTSCPACRWWCTRQVAGKELVNMIVFYKSDKGEVIEVEDANPSRAGGGLTPFVRSTYRTDYRCKRCKHKWSATSTDEYKKPESDRPGVKRHKI